MSVDLIFEYPKEKCKNCDFWKIVQTRLPNGIRFTASCQSESECNCSCCYTPIDTNCEIHKKIEQQEELKTAFMYWQRCDRIHPFTCLDHSEYRLIMHVNLEDDKLSLKCPMCDYIQEIDEETECLILDFYKDRNKVKCKNCGQPIGDSTITWSGLPICKRCNDSIERACKNG